MSAPNPSVRTCAYCDEPPVRDYPHYPMCVTHDAMRKERTPEQVNQEKLAYAITVAETCDNANVLGLAADSCDQGIRDSEFNFPAEIIMQVGRLTPADYILAAAEEMMMQLAFLNAGVNPPCSFIMAAFKGGWRYRIDKGFHKEGKTA